MELEHPSPWRFPSFPALLGGVGAAWLLLALVSWLSGAMAARALLAVFSGGVLLAGFAWYCWASWAWRLGRAAPASCLRPVLLFVFGWLLCLGSALTNVVARGGGTDTPEPPKKSKLFANGPRRFLSDMQEFDVVDARLQQKEWPFRKNGQLNDKAGILVDGKISSKGLSLLPVSGKFSSVKYRLDGEAAVFKARVALNDDSNPIFGPATFEVLGDGISRWESKPISKPREVQECVLDVADVNVLELRVHAKSFNHGLHAVWLEPRLLQQKDTEDR